MDVRNNGAATAQLAQASHSRRRAAAQSGYASHVSSAFPPPVPVTSERLPPGRAAGAPANARPPGQAAQLGYATARRALEE